MLPVFAFENTLPNHYDLPMEKSLEILYAGYISSRKYFPEESSNQTKRPSKHHQASLDVDLVSMDR